MFLLTIMDYFPRKSLSKYLIMDTIYFNKHVLRNASVGGISYIWDQYKSEHKIETGNGYKSALARRAFFYWFLLTLTDFHSP
jgi:hypothetical protein